MQSCYDKHARTRDVKVTETSVTKNRRQRHNSRHPRSTLTQLYSQSIKTQRIKQALRSQRYTQQAANNSRQVSMNNNDDDKIAWFAMSAPYRRELKAKERLAAMGIETFVPMTKAIVERRGTKRCEAVPAIHNLIFAHTSKENIKQAKQNIEYLQYRTYPFEGKNKPITVPDKDMKQFIAITNARMEDITYLRPDEIDIKKGTKVRIHGGEFNGTEGIFVKLKGKRNRRVVVLIEGVAAIAINAELSPDIIEVIK